MPLTAAQICTRACQIARVPGFVAQAGDTLNVVLNELCQDYDFDLAKKTFQFNFNTAALNRNGQAYQNLPADYLRGIRNQSFYIIQGVPYPMIPMDLAEIDMLVQQSGVSNFPVFYTVDMSRDGMTNDGTRGVPVALFWMPPSGAYPVTLRYFSQMPEVVNPSSSITVPWFPNQNYLITRIAGELMKDADDERKTSYLSDVEPGGAAHILKKYLMMKDDKGDRAQVVTLDRRRFGRAFDRLKNTKTIGWVIPLTWILAGDILWRIGDASWMIPSG
jgi:hypothetical protein